jgi:putative ABC transport system ATP-binding protein
MLATTALTFRYPDGAFELRTDPLEVERGGTLALVGPSGCGKSTLLTLLAGERVPSSGAIRFGDRRIDSLGDAERRAFRIRSVGLVFQEFRLVDHLSVLDNILLPCRLHPVLPLDAAARRRAAELAERLGIAHLLRRLPERISHGERQRVAVARALIARPAMVLADEPTGNLDPVGKRRLVDELLGVARDDGAIVIVATHDHGLLPRFDATMDLGDARIAATRSGG